VAEFLTIDIGELEFDSWMAGKENEELIIFLHGFPEASIMWAGLMDHLAARGFFCVAPDMRGYSQGACPKGLKNYTVEKLGADILNIADALGKRKFHLVGHDWGAAIGWDVVYNNPKRILSWAALSVPHNKAFAKAYHSDPVQKKKSRYIALFLLPYLPEILIRRNNFKWFRKLWRNSSDAEVNYYLSIFRRRASLTGALNYYRANLRRGKMKPISDIQTPTLFIWGKKDLAVGELAAKGTEKYMKGDYTFLELEGGHWLVQTNYSEVTSALVRHLSACRTTPEDA